MPSPLPPLINTWVSPALPPGYGWEHRNQEQLEILDRFVHGIDSRDTFNGIRRCLVCGESRQLHHCHIIPNSAPCQLVALKAMGWLPPQANGSGADEPRNGFLLCRVHHHLFNKLHFFVRFFPDIEKFVVVCFRRPSNPDLEQYDGTSIALQLEPFHGKAIPFNINHPLLPFPSLFLQHEMRSRMAHFFTPTLDIPDIILDQDWMS